jgi:hypothetical protein
MNGLNEWDLHPKAHADIVEPTFEDKSPTIWYVIIGGFMLAILVGIFMKCKNGNTKPQIQGSALNQYDQIRS